ncbi:Putative protein ImpH/VasB [Photobacterium marinum]|uniref:Type VI secretion system baseplate subunit TssG n=1 Tax=Photobacterium marinum TaxID=1056511 RepID=L8J725_9GAMM|nr:type VI secretion system baseplate subunit TssG [Photobacterium marinum]ELR64596.1 Putative protein ImpH/VasB [Photobacterium marinum]
MKIAKLIERIDKNNFYETVYALQRWLSLHFDCGVVGTDTLPANEGIRFKVSQHLGFPGAAIESVSQGNGGKENGVSCYVNFTGLTGPSGALPSHYTELLMERVRLKDTALRDFFDIFNHRLLSLHYRTWEKFNFPAQYEKQLRGIEAPQDQILRALTGAQHDAEVFLGGLFAQQIRNTKTLQQILEILTGCQIEIREFVGRWVSLREDEQTSLGSNIQPEGQYARLGVSTFLGQRVWDITSAIDVEIIGASPDQCLELMSRGKLTCKLKQVVSHYVPTSVDVKWYLKTTYRSLPIADLRKSSPGLGQGASLMMRRCYLDKPLSIPVC